MATYIRGNPASVEGTLKKGAKSGVAPLITVSVGTAGASRNWRFIERMIDAGRLHRVQSVVIYDYNQGTLDKIRRRSTKVKGRMHGASIHLPEKVRAMDGFLLNPYAFGEYLGVIDGDMDNMVAEIRKRTHEVGAPPQLIIEFLGFGGHAIIGLLLHKKIRAAFPEAHCVPIIALPNDPSLAAWMHHELEPPQDIIVSQEWMRRGTWRAYEDQLFLREREDCLLVDNRIDCSPNDLLAMGLATIESAGTDSMKSGSLPEAVAGIKHDAQGWCGMNVIRKNLPARRGWGFGFPLRRLKLVWSSDDELPVQVKAGIKESLYHGSLLDPEIGFQNNDRRRLDANGVESDGRQLGSDLNQYPDQPGNGVANGHKSTDQDHALKQIYVAVPLKLESLRSLERHVMKQLEAEKFFDKYPRVSVRFGSANFPDRPEDVLEDVAQIPPEIPVRVLRWATGLLTSPFTLTYRLARLAVFGRQPSARELYATIATLIPFHGRIGRIDEIMHGTHAGQPTGSDGARGTGFGTWVHARPPTAQASAGSNESQESKESQETAGQGPEDPRQSGPSEDETAQARNGPAPHSTADEEGGDPMPVGVPTVGAAEASEGETWAGGPVSEVSPEGALNEQSDSEKVDSPGEYEDDSSESTP